MRLGQLARQLSLSPSLIIEFLAKQNIPIEDNSNTRLEDDHVRLVLQHYAPERLVEAIEEDAPMEEVINEETQPVASAVEKELPLVEVTVEPEPSTLPEVIRAPKIELSGLKVLGKIDLPEVKKKEAEKEEPAAEVKPKRTSSRDQFSKGKRDHRNRPSKKEGWVNPLELQREREAKEAEERIRLAIEREKEKRKKHYEQKVKGKVKIKSPKPESEAPAEKLKAPRQSKPEPTSLIGKFWKWLRME